MVKHNVNITAPSEGSVGFYNHITIAASGAS